MARFSERSERILKTCHPDLQALFNAVVEHFDCTILEGQRSKERQERLYQEGKSKTMQSLHLRQPSMAVDVAPYPVDWRDEARFYLFAGFVLATAEQLHIPIRWGGDWDRDLQVSDNKFNDLVHYELDMMEWDEA